jgi:hypothetical protein
VIRCRRAAIRVVRRPAAIREARRRAAIRAVRRRAATREGRPPATVRGHREGQEVRAVREAHAATREAPELRGRPVRRRVGTVRAVMAREGRWVRAVRVPAATGQEEARVVRVRAATGRAGLRCSALASGPSVRRNAATAARCGRAVVPVVPAWAPGPRVQGRRLPCPPMS